MKRKAPSTSAQTTEEWKAIFAVTSFHPPRPTGTTDDDDDPFDCSDVRFPSTFELVEQSVKEYQKRWEQLDERKVKPVEKTIQDTFGKEEEENDEEEDPEKDPTRQEAESTRKKRPWGGWRFMEDRLRLPHCFDYMGVGIEPEDDGTGDRVLTLSGLRTHDHSQQPDTTSYEKELWKLFRNIPSSMELQAHARSGAQLSNSIRLQKSIFDAMNKHNPPDRHLLARMRTADRHGLPPPEIPRREDGSIPVPDTPTLRFECWRKQPHRRPSPDPNRMELEFTSDQTLLDFHMALVQMQEDVLWEDAVGKEETPSGCFFFEGEFYSHGDIDYSTPLTEWIDGGNQEPNPVRRGYLGISSETPFQKKSMKNVLLKDLPLRLGFRYYHVCHGDVETSVFLTDRRVTWESHIRYPILHDIWTAPNRVPFCDACGTFNAAYITSPTLVETDETRRLLCEHCRELLNIPRDKLALYAAFRDEAMLSSGFLPKGKRDHS